MSRAPRLLAFVVGRNQPVVVHDLGASGPVSQAIGVAREFGPDRRCD